MSVLVAIPARYASTRYPGKPLVELTGATGARKTLVQRSWEAACQVKGVDRLCCSDNKACFFFGLPFRCLLQ